LSEEPGTPLTEKMLAGMGGWDVLRFARALRDAGSVEAASFDGKCLRGRVRSGGKWMPAGLIFHSKTDVENLCPCKDSRLRALICAHSVAVGLAVISGPGEQPAPEPVRVPVRPRGKPTMGTPTDERPAVRIFVEGSLKAVDVRVEYTYSRPGLCNAVAEAGVLERLEMGGCVMDGSRGSLRGEVAVAGFFAGALPRLKSEMDVRIGERFGRVTESLIPIEPHFAIKDRSDGWLDFHVHFVAGRDAVFAPDDLRKLLAGGDPRVKLGNGRVAVADAELAADLEEVLRDCQLRRDGAGLQVPAAHAPYLRACIADWTGRPGEGDMPRLKAEELGTLRGVLRPYQVEGALWLLARARSGGFGLLADDMGLGKTLQALAMMSAHPGPHLVVCPSSLVWNWAREAARFVPSLRVATIDGARREEKWKAAAKSDLLITSYALLRRDSAHYRNMAFSTVTLDEAQHIKNPASQNAAAARALPTRARYILTGTPLENSVRDLWSLFEFLSPGLLGTQNDFRERYEKPVAEGGASRRAVWPRLMRRVRPHMLRREKSQILDELPPKIEQVLEVDLTPAQQTAYTELQIAARSRMEELARDGSLAVRARALAALLRLRQICCDPRLLGAKTGPSDSAKLEILREVVSEACDGGHKVLVFSQFTSMLDLIGEAFAEDGISYVRLDGSTRNRAHVVNEFQENPSVNAFLISLKAGGVGLTLTAADTVILFDPWWNPAVESQAADRAHRIGQTRIVTTIRLVAKETVEQRVVDLQSDKRTLLGALLDPEADAAPGGSLDASELAALVR
jgi:superfamily II DNA or RNA helicase